jgi:hypothetical protein
MLGLYLHELLLVLAALEFSRAIFQVRSMLFSRDIGLSAFWATP